MNDTLPVSVIISTYKTKEVGLKALAALYASTPLPEQIIVIDNDSQDDSIAAYKAAFPQATYVVNQKNSVGLLSLKYDYLDHSVS